ncbi:MAG: aminoacetone oxidase family FAD-binding enzyme [Lachnospiraceae bacterium]|nr:aminoacetone oxidase family FAD-binding enzyme [bacterium]MDY5517311.1 aminoacetone oxidase family FAD-binding enzyme [Lachnospiraceae bacterium]
MSKKNVQQAKDCWDVIVVGGGAAGLMAAIHAARGGASVLILEHMERPGKKLLMTGNGKCNFTNEAFFNFDKSQDETGYEQYYHGACPAFVLPAIKKFNLTSTLNFFEDLGIVPVKRRGGYYPAGGQASGVLAAMLMECGRLGIEIACEIGIRSIRRAEKTDISRSDFSTEQNIPFVIETKSGTYIARRCILATGGKSYKKSGSDGSGFLYVEHLGHRIQDLVPALVPLQSDLAFFKKVAGIRAEISAKIYIENEMQASESGELQLTDYGISGICIFQISYLASQALARQQSVCVELDFLADKTEDETVDLILERTKSKYASGKTMAQCMIGLFNDKLGVALLEESGIVPTQMGRELTREQAVQLMKKIKHFSVPIRATRSFEQAQVTAGGVDTAQVVADTMESKLVPGFYFAGEMLDVDGICGGFNLQWAWSSGAVAGMCAAASISDISRHERGSRV